jgi:hypothetical protein
MLNYLLSQELLRLLSSAERLMDCCASVQSS